jgi:NitT/TauT family transport system substrate-binding protein
MLKRSIQRSVYFTVTTVLLLSIAVSGGFGKIDAARKIATVRVGYMPGPSSSSAVAIADTLGYFKNVGIKIDGKKFLTGPEEFQAMQAGDLDIINIGPGATHLAAKGQGIVIMLDCLGMSDYLVTYKGSGVNTVRDLKGKLVGVPKGTSAEMMLNLALQKEGMSQKDLKDGSAANIAASGIVSAIVAKQVSAVATWVVYGEAIKKEIGAANFVVLADDKSFYPQHIFPGSWVVNPNFLKKHPDRVVGFLKALLKANDFRAKNREETCKITSQYDGSNLNANYANYDNTKWLTSAELKAAYQDGTVSKWYEGLEKMFMEIGIMQGVVPADKFVNVLAITRAFKN